MSYVEEFQRIYEQIRHYERLMILLEWDMYTATPSAGYEGMTDTLSWVSAQHFALSTSDEFLELLGRVRESDEFETLGEGLQYTVRKMQEDLAREKKVPQDFHVAMTREVSLSQRAWEQAKRTNDYSLFAPHLEQVLAMTKERCHYTDPDRDAYEVLLDRYEKGMGTERIDRVFAELKEGLLPLLDQILAHQPAPVSLASRTFPAEQQRRVQDLLLNYIGFDFERGTTAESEHPFTTGFDRRDIRVTNHFREHDPVDAMFSAIHEGGHALFDQGVDESLMGTMAESCPWMGVHESQSRFMENILGRRRSFWVPVYPQVQQIMPGLQDISLNDFAAAVSHVQRSLIRTQADEVTYGLHIILRYEIERMLFSDEVSVADLPQVWNEKMQQYLHLTPPDDAGGVLQDMHWSDGSFGYFPSYLLGSIYDGMFLEAMERDLGDVDPILEQGRIRELTGWLHDKIHRYGALREPAEVLSNVCGCEVSAAPLLNYFRKKYLGE